MKIAVALLVIIPMVLSNPIEKRLVLDTFFGDGGIFQGNEIKLLIDQIVAIVGAEATEKQCEGQCHIVVKADHLFQNACPLVCRSFQSLVQKFGHVTTTTTQAPA